MIEEPTQPKDDTTQHNFPPPAVHAWDRQMEESPTAYEAFTLYLEQGAINRSMSRTAVKLGKSRHLVERWSVEWSWEKRAYAYDCEQDHIRRMNHRREIESMSDRHAKMARAMSNKIIDRLKALDPQDIGPRDIATWFKAIVDIERYAMGEGRMVRSTRRGRPPKFEESNSAAESTAWKTKAARAAIVAARQAKQPH